MSPIGTASAVKMEMEVDAMQTTADVEIAVLQVQFKHIQDNVIEVKKDLKEISTTIQENNDSLLMVLKEANADNNAAHARLTTKISGFERWRWMLMGAGAALGALGFDTITKLLKM